MSLVPKLLVLVVAAVFFVAVAQRSHELVARSEFEIREPPLVNLSPRTVSLLFLGFKNIYDDLLAIWAVHYLASDEPEKYDQDKFDLFLQKISRMRHSIESIYMFSCFVLTMVERPLSCVPILQTGMEVMPHSWRLPLTMGFVYSFELDEPAKAAIYYNVCSERENAPEYIKGTASKLAKKGNTTLEELDRSMAEILGISEDSEFYKILKKKYRPNTEEENEL